MSKLVLFCFPYAGGSESIYNKWRNYLHPNIELQPIYYAGRGRRFQESCYHDMDDVTNDIFENINRYIYKSNYSFFGHSMGGLIAYELCKKMVRESFLPPKHIFLSGIKPPNHVRRKKVHNLPEKEFKKKIFELNGTPKEVLNNQQLMDIFLPILRSDFKLIEEYKFSKEGYKLNTSITALYGEQDDITKEDMKKWTDFTAKDSRVLGYPGGHFFINENYINIIDLINRTLIRSGGYYG